MCNVLRTQVNAEPHMGSAYTTMAADAITRFQRLQGKRVTLVTGTLLVHTSACLSVLKVVLRMSPEDHDQGYIGAARPPMCEHAS